MTSPDHEFVYLTAKQIAAINADQDNGGSVRDAEALNRSADRPKTEVGDSGFITVWQKTAALIHGIANNHPFLEANKRAAWYSAVTFLRMNGVAFPEVPTIEAETFTRAVAQQVYDSAETGCDLTLEKASEWFESKCTNRRRGPAIDARLEYAFLGIFAEPSADEDGVRLEGVFNVHSMGVAILQVRGQPPFFPYPSNFCIVGRVHWTDADLDRNHLLQASVAPLGEAKRVNRASSTLMLDPPVLSAHKHQTGYIPVIFAINVAPVFLSVGDYTVDVRIDGADIARLPLKVDFAADVPDIIAF